MSIRTPLGKVRGLGSAKQGTHHFWVQRLSAVALVPLLIWVLASAVAYAGASYEDVRSYLGHPVSAVLFILFLGTAFHHMKLGLQIVIEDYIHAEGSKIALLILVNLFTYTFAALAIFSVLKIALTEG